MSTAGQTNGTGKSFVIYRAAKERFAYNILILAGRYLLNVEARGMLKENNHLNVNLLFPNGCGFNDRLTGYTQSPTMIKCMWCLAQWRVEYRETNIIKDTLYINSRRLNCKRLRVKRPELIFFRMNMIGTPNEVEPAEAICRKYQEQWGHSTTECICT